MEHSLKITIIIASYKRVESLSKCLLSLTKQTRIPDEILVVYKEHDQPTRIVAEDFSSKHPNISIKVVSVKENSILAAENRGISMASGDIICFIDDDAEAYNDWIERMLQYYKDPVIGGVGGRDILVNLKLPQKKNRKIGYLTWYGKLYGGHHIGTDTPLSVHFLKGCNMSYRRSVIKTIDTNLIGEVTFGFEVDIGLTVISKGYKIIYDPLIQVDHHVLTSHSKSRMEDDRNFGIIFNSNHNQTYLLLKHLSFPKNIIALIFSIIVGSDHIHSGIILSVLRILIKQNLIEFKTTYHSMRGKMAGLRTYLISIKKPTVFYSPWECLCSSKKVSNIRTGIYNRIGIPNYKFQIVKCVECGLLRTCPKPSPITNGSSCTTIIDDQQPLMTDQYKDSAHLERAEWISSYITSGKVLDIGCDTGKFLEILEGLGNYTATGIETSKSSSEYGKKKGRRIHNCDLLDIKFPNKYFDGITLFHVLEHIEKIECTLREIFRILKPGGYVFVVVPNHKGLMARLRKEQWAGFFPQEHFWHFNKKTLIDTLTNSYLFKPICVTSCGASEEFTTKGWRGILINIVFFVQRILHVGGTVEGVFRK